MKGLLLKEFYVTIKSCKTYLIIDAVFIVMSFVLNEIIDGSVNFMMMPILMSGMLVVSLLNFDEKYKWTKYSASLPYTPAQIVSAKYLFGLIFQVATTLAVFTASCLWVFFTGGMTFSEVLVTILGMFVFSLTIPSVSLPLCYKLGTEKGRLLYFGIIFAITMVIMKYSDALGHAISSDIFLIMIIAAVVGIYALSWIISISICRGREITN